MSANRLLAHFDRIAEAPDAAPRLRRLILDLAVRGRLVEQDPEDEPAADCLEEARARLKSVAQVTKRLRWQHSTPISFNNVDKEIPEGWIPARINDTGLYINGLAFKPSDWKKKGLPIVRIQNLTDPTKDFNFATGDFPDEVLVRNGDLLVSWSATLEAFKWNRGAGVLNQHIFRVMRDEQLTTRDFLFLLLRYAIREMADSEHAHGVVMKHINRGPFLNHIVLIPPLAEQRRIVAKVDELMALCDRLEAAQTQREEARERLTAASLARLSEPDPETFRADARFALNALPTLAARPEQMQALRRLILDLAVRGRLVEQDPEDEPAAELLKRIAKEKARLAKAGKIRKTKPLPPVDKAPFELPENWLWARIRQISSDHGQTRPKTDFTYIDVTAIDKEKGLVASPNVMTANEAPSRARKIVREGDVVYSCVRPYLLNVAIVNAAFDPPPIASTAFAILDGHGFVLPRFQWIVLRSHFMTSCVEGKMRGQAYPAINDTDFARLPFPLPPLAEQRRIVAKVDELMALCDRLEEKLSGEEEAGGRLLDALLAEATNA